MRNRITKRVSKAFTLVEILIVVVILGILAAIVVPQFANATRDSQAGNLKAQIKSIQNQLELAKARSTDGTYPDLVTSWDAFITGGYVKSLPKNPFNQLSIVVAAAADVDGSGNPTGGISGDATAGWAYDQTLGVFGASYFDEVNGVLTPAVP